VLSHRAHHRGGKCVAHLLQDVLEHLHILANHEWDARALLSLVLVGLPELKDRLSLT